MWNDCGFTEGCIEVPSKTSVLPEPDLVFDRDFNPSMTKMFSEIQLKADYLSLMNVSYLEVTYTMNNSDELVVYGWVDSVSMKSDSANYPMTVVNWHIDLWRTFLSKAEFGMGTVMRRPLKGTSHPPQSYPYRYRTVKPSFTPKRLCGSDSIWWVIMTVNSTAAQDTSVTTVYAVPVSIESPSTALYIDVGGAKKTVSLAEFISGTWDETLGLMPETVKSMFLSPVAPNTVSGSGTQSSPLSMTGWGGRLVSVDKDTYVMHSTNAVYREFTATLPSTVASDDVDSYIVTGFDGEVIGSIPWGLSCKDYTYRLVVATASAYIQIRFDGIASRPEGLCFTIPLIAMEVTENSWSTYVYSGARQTDIDQRRLQAESQAVSSGISTGVSALQGGISGAMMGAMAGAVGGPIGMVAGALIGGVGASLASGLTAGANYAYQTGRYADEAQRISDYAHASQPNGLLMAGSGFDVLSHGNLGIYLSCLTMDDYSKGVRESDIEMFGVNVEEPTESCQSLVDAGGPLRIANLIVRGDIPVGAKQYIKGRLASGVRMI